MTYPVNNGRGPAGPQGLQGEKGDAGAVGAAGPSGSTGAVGAQGVQGVKGDQGLQGLQGQTGLAGATGLQGAQGLPGVTGATGAAGAKGDKGDRGEPGSQGASGANGSNGANGISYNPQTPVVRTLTIGTAFQHTDTAKPFKAVVNVRATQTLTVAGLSADKIELRAGPNAASVAAGGSGGFSLGVWESGITGIALMVGAGIQDGGSMLADVPAGWYLQINRLAGTSATIVSAFTQSLTA